MCHQTFRIMLISSTYFAHNSGWQQPEDSYFKGDVDVVIVCLGLPPSTDLPITTSVVRQHSGCQLPPSCSCQHLEGQMSDAIEPKTPCHNSQICSQTRKTKKGGDAFEWWLWLKEEKNFKAYAEVAHFSWVPLILVNLIVAKGRMHSVRIVACHGRSL